MMCATVISWYVVVLRGRNIRCRLTFKLDADALRIPLYLIVLSSSLFCPESVTMKPQSLAVGGGAKITITSVINLQKAGWASCCMVVHAYALVNRYILIKPLYMFEPPAPRGSMILNGARGRATANTPSFRKGGTFSAARVLA